MKMEISKSTSDYYNWLSRMGLIETHCILYYPGLLYSVKGNYYEKLQLEHDLELFHQLNPTVPTIQTVGTNDKN